MKCLIKHFKYIQNYMHEIIILLFIYKYMCSMSKYFFCSLNHLKAICSYICMYLCMYLCIFTQWIPKLLRPCVLWIASAFLAFVFVLSFVVVVLWVFVLFCSFFCHDSSTRDSRLYSCNESDRSRNQEHFLIHLRKK